MPVTRKQTPKVAQRAIRVLLDVLPSSARTEIPKRGSGTDLVVAGQRLRIEWIGEGNLGDARGLLSDRKNLPDIVAARRLSPGARQSLSNAEIGWVDETGAAEISVGTIIVSRTGRPPKSLEKPDRWPPATIAVAEAILCGTKPAVSATARATGLSIASCTHALRILTDLSLLEAPAARGRDSARRLTDPDQFLVAYTAAVDGRVAGVSLQVGVTWRDPVAALRDVGRTWSKAKRRWACTGVAAASVIGPYLTAVTSTEVYVEANTIAALEAVATAAGLRPIEGGRLTLRPFPTVAVRQLANEIDGLWVAPWPRVYVDLRRSGVRGEEAAEHLREVVRAG